MLLSQTLRQLRLKSKLSQEIISERLGISQSTYCNWESGKSLPNARSLSQLAQLFGVPVTELIPGDLQEKLQTDSSPKSEATYTAQQLYQALTDSQQAQILLLQQRVQQLEAENEALRRELNRQAPKTDNDCQ
ncbi:helix-turn-helix domain-containing protein [Tellurirhabdus rosea]|uniref:helix-turn-helix domain-containing protein n=1 Tax=Tellurirhabdus rosea TaxID=2674997 RepID=UPI00224CD0F1|nr:helix-turn-helix transcriptional regulator [Tellurirhabdus rosea]